MQNPSDLLNGLDSAMKILAHCGDEERDHFRNNDEPEDHIYREFAPAEESISTIGDILRLEVNAYGETVNVAQLLMALDSEEAEDHFSALAESLAMEGHAPFDTGDANAGK